MNFPEKLDVLTIHARLITETAEQRGSETKPCLSRLLRPLKIVIFMRPQML
jgi:hypothetical protein